ncbi:MAG: peptidoglycan D,D-transpeptidase FtsI family protein [bacterium]
MNSIRETISNRAIVLLLLFGLIFGIIILNYAYLMVINPVNLEDTPSKGLNSRRATPPRGKIVDSSGNLLATSIQRQSLYANPRQIQDPWKTARELAPLLNAPPRSIYDKLIKNRFFVWLSRKVPEKVVKRVRKMELEGIGFVPEYERVYPQTIYDSTYGDTYHTDKWGLAAQVLGFVGIDNQGLAGVERRFDNILSRADVSGKGPPGQHSWDVAENSTIKLTLDQTIQYIVEEELAKMAESERPKNAMVVVMEPSTGEVKALANWPTYDPNYFSKAKSSLRRNRAISNSFEPGSTLKVMTLSSGLAVDAFKPEDTYNCPGYIYFHKARHTLKCYANHGEIPIPEILIKSCNVGTVKAVMEMKPGIFYRRLRRFGFGNTTGIELPGEANGDLRKPYEWSTLTQPSMAIGQGISVTALQLTTALSGVVNDGVLMKPKIVKAISNKTGEFQRKEPIRVRRVLPVHVARSMKTYMQKVVSKGTGQNAYSKRFRLGGKTGTAQKANPQGGGYLPNKNLLSFIGFGPVKKPKLAVSVIIDEPQVSEYGGQAGAIVFKRIMERSLQYLKEKESVQKTP